MVWLLILEEPNQSSMEIMLHSTASLKDDMKKWYSNGSPAKVWISTSGADCCCNKLHKILLISPSKYLSNKALFAWASAAQLVLSHDFFEDDLMVLLLKAFDTYIVPLYHDWHFCGFNICWWTPAVAFVFDAAWSLLNSSLVATSFLIKTLSCIVAYTSDLAFAFDNFSWRFSLLKKFCFCHYISQFSLLL